MVIDVQYRCFSAAAESIKEKILLCQASPRHSGKLYCFGWLQHLLRQRVRAGLPSVVRNDVLLPSSDYKGIRQRWRMLKMTAYYYSSCPHLFLDMDQGARNQVRWGIDNFPIYNSVYMLKMQVHYSQCGHTIVRVWR